MYENEERITETEVVDGLRALLYGESLEDTLLDGSRSFTATAQLSGAVAPGAQVAVSYSGAGAGGQEYVSAAILDSGGNWLYYGAIAQNSASGTASVTVPEDLAAGTTPCGCSPSSAGATASPTWPAVFRILN